MNNEGLPVAVYVTLSIFLGIICIIALILRAIPFLIWIRAKFSGADVGIIQLISMKIRRVPPDLIIDNLIMLTKADCSVPVDKLESLYMAGGNITDVSHAFVAAKKAGIALDFDRAAAIELAGRKVFEAVRMSVNPKVIETPKISAVSKDGIQVIATARVTLRANLVRLVGGAGEETILARVGEGIVTTIGSSESHKNVLENPDMISKVVLAKGLDSGTAFEILSIDISDVDIGSNIGAVLQTDQAEADKKIAQAKAEEKRAMALAKEQEMRALKEEMRARVVEAERAIPQAIAEAFRSGKLGIRDYYQLENIQADTKMRNNIGGTPPPLEETDSKDS